MFKFVLQFYSLPITENVMSKKTICEVFAEETAFELSRIGIAYKVFETEIGKEIQFDMTDKQYRIWVMENLIASMTDEEYEQWESDKEEF